MAYRVATYKPFARIICPMTRPTALDTVARTGHNDHQSRFRGTPTTHPCAPRMTLRATHASTLPCATPPAAYPAHHSLAVPSPLLTSLPSGTGLHPPSIGNLTSFPPLSSHPKPRWIGWGLMHGWLRPRKSSLARPWSFTARRIRRQRSHPRGIGRNFFAPRQLYKEACFSHS